MAKLRLSEKERIRVAALSKVKSGGMTLRKGAEFVALELPPDASSSFS